MVSEIEFRRKKIAEMEEELKSMQKNSTDYFGLKEKIIERKNDLEISENEQRASKIEKHKEKIKRSFENGEIDEEEYDRLLGILGLLNNSIELIEEESYSRAAVNKIKLNNIKEENKDKKYYYQRFYEHHELDKKLKDSIKECISKLWKYQLESGRITEQEYTEKNDKSEITGFSINDIDRCIDEMTNNTISKEHELNEECIQNSFPNSDINNVAIISDWQTQNILTQLYGIENDENTKIVAIHHSNHNKVDVIGMEDSEIGECISLCTFNSKTGRIETLESSDFSPEVISKGNDVTINSPNESYNVNEMATFSYGGFKLTYYLNDNGEMQIGRGENGKIKETSTYSMERYKELNEQKKKMNEQNSISSKENHNINRKTEIKSPEELHSINSENLLDPDKVNELLKFFSEKMKSRKQKIEADVDAPYKEDVEKRRGRLL